MKHAPDVSKAALILTGATEIRHSFPAAIQPIVIDGYMQGLKVTFAIAITGAGLTTIISLLTRWKKLNTEKLSGGMA